MLRRLLIVTTLVLLVTLATASFAQVGVSVTIAPPALPVYEQPLCPGDGYIWTPGTGLGLMTAITGSRAHG